MTFWLTVASLFALMLGHPYLACFLLYIALHVTSQPDPDQVDESCEGSPTDTISSQPDPTDQTTTHEDDNNKK